MKNTLLEMYRKEGTMKVLASLISIVIGLLVEAWSATLTDRKR